MRYRKLDEGGDYSFGKQLHDFYIDVPDAPAQAALTRLRLLKGEWFLDTDEGTDWYGAVLGHHTESTRNLEIQTRVLDTVGVTSIESYASSVVADTRDFNVSMTLATVYGAAKIKETL